MIIITTGSNDHTCLYIQEKLARKYNEFVFYPQYFLGVNSSTFSTSWGLEIDVPTTEINIIVVEKIRTTRKTFKPYVTVCMVSRRASHFDLEVRDRQEARRGTCGVECGLL